MEEEGDTVDEPLNGELVVEDVELSEKNVGEISAEVEDVVLQLDVLLG